MIHPLFNSQLPNSYCTIITMNLYGAVIFSGNRAGQGGNDMYGATLMDCEHIISHVADILMKPHGTLTLLL